MNSTFIIQKLSGKEVYKFSLNEYGRVLKESLSGCSKLSVDLNEDETIYRFLVPSKHSTLASFSDEELMQELNERLKRRIK
mgnify:FL=1